MGFFDSKSYSAKQIFFVCFVFFSFFLVVFSLFGVFPVFRCFDSFGVFGFSFFFRGFSRFFVFFLFLFCFCLFLTFFSGFFRFSKTFILNPFPLHQFFDFQAADRASTAFSNKEFPNCETEGIAPPEKEWNTTSRDVYCLASTWMALADQRKLKVPKKLYQIIKTMQNKFAVDRPSALQVSTRLQQIL